MIRFIVSGAAALLILLYFYMILPRLSSRKNMRPFRRAMFAHRGYHCADKLIPENSMPAFRAAIRHGYGIELDLRLTRDGRLVVFHDDNLTRMCRVPGRIESYTYEELKRFRLLNTAEKIPLFSEVLSCVDGRVPLLIELKIPGSSLQICEAACRMLNNYSGTFLIQSFNTMGLYWFRRNAPHILRGQLSSRLTKENLDDPWILRFLVEHLLTNFLGRPDFISYKLSDLPRWEVFVCHKFFRSPIAVWTLRTEQALKCAKRRYDIQIFEKALNFY